MGLDIGFNFRATEAFVTDDPPCVYGTRLYPYVAGGVTFGWQNGLSGAGVSVAGGARDRNAGIDPRFSGHVGPSNTNHYFRVDLPPGEYDIAIANGEYNFASNTQVVEFSDGGVAWLALPSVNVPARSYRDSSGVIRTSVEDWIANQVPERHALTSSFRLRYPGGGSFMALSHVRITEASSDEVSPSSATASVAVSAPSVSLSAGVALGDVEAVIAAGAPSVFAAVPVTPGDAGSFVGLSTPSLSASAAVKASDAALSISVSPTAVALRAPIQIPDVLVGAVASSPDIGGGTSIAPSDALAELFVISPTVLPSGGVAPADAGVQIYMSAPTVRMIAPVQPSSAVVTIGAEAPAVTPHGTITPPERVHRACSRPLVYRVSCRVNRIHVAGPRQRIHKIGRP